MIAKEENGSQAADNGGEKKPRHRSPAYPTIGLREAVERVEKLWKADGKAGAPSKLAAVHIGYGKAHGQAYSSLAALKKFGLVTEANRRIVPSQRAIEILNLPAEDPRRQKALKDAILEPAIYRELIEKHKITGWPSGDVLESDLVTYKGFNPNSVSGFVKDLMDGLEFSGLSDLSALESNAEDGEMPENLSGHESMTVGSALAKSGDKLRGRPIIAQTLVISIPRNFRVDIGVCADELKKEDLAKIKSQFNRWIEGLEEAFE